MQNPNWVKLVPDNQASLRLEEEKIIHWEDLDLNEILASRWVMVLTDYGVQRSAKSVFLQPIQPDSIDLVLVHTLNILYLLLI